MTLPVNINPNLPRKIGGPTLQSLDQYDQDFLNRVQSELREHARAINDSILSEGTWTPTLSADTVGNLTVAYTTQIGRWRRVGKFVTANFEVTTSTWTHTTASGDFRILGLPYAADGVTAWRGPLFGFQGFTSANFTQLMTKIDAATPTMVKINKSGSAQSLLTTPVTDWPTTGTVRVIGEITYKVV